MAVETKQKRIHYRKAMFTAGKNFNLQSLVTAALNTLAQVQTRQQPTTVGGTEFRLINLHTSQQSILFGDFFTYEAGVNKLQVEVDPAAPTLDVKQVAPRQTNPKKRSEFLDNLLFFAIFNNHVVIMQTHALQGKSFESYLNWLLEQAKVVTANRVELSDVPPAAIRQKATSNDIKAISFRTPVVEIDDEQTLDGQATTKRQTVATERKIGADVIRSILGEDDFRKLHIDQAAGGNLRVDMRIFFDRATTESGQKALNNIARALRNTDIDDEDLRLDIPGVGTVKGSELKLTKGISVQAMNGVVLPDQVFPQMATWIHDLIKNQLVE